MTLCGQHCPVIVTSEFEQNQITSYELNHFDETRPFLSNQTHYAIAWQGLDDKCMLIDAGIFAFSRHTEELSMRAVDVLRGLNSPSPVLILIFIVILL